MLKASTIWQFLHLNRIFFQFKRKKCFKIFVQNLKNSGGSQALKILCFWEWKKILLPCANADFKINMSECMAFLK